MTESLNDEDYRRLLLLRTGLRRFLHQSETRAQEAGLTAAQHQLLLAIRGHDVREGPTISDIATYLLLRHHSAVELVDRAVSAGLVIRSPDPHDARVVRLSLTKTGARALTRLTARNRDELARLADRFRPLWHDLDDEQNDATPLSTKRQLAERFIVARVYDNIETDARRILVDRLWPRGFAKADATFEWRKHLAPSTELRRWYAHDPERFKEFSRRYRSDLEAQHLVELAELAKSGGGKPLVLLTATKEIERSGAAVLASVLVEQATAQLKPKRKPTTSRVKSDERL